MPQNSQHPPGDSTRVAVPSGAQLCGQKKTTTQAKLNPSPSALKDHARTYITVQDILTSLIIHDNPTAKGHPMVDKPRQSLKDLETDLNVWVVEKYNNKGGISQCRRCQQFGHSSINCKLSMKWVKCAGQHLTKDLSITNHTENPICANCNGSHPASYRGCPKFPKLNSTNNKQPANTFTFNSNFSKPNISYSSITSNNPNNTNDTPSLLNTLKEVVFDSEILLLLQVIKNVLLAIKNATNSYDKMYALIKATSEVFEQANI
ncbi:nucleic-acid-binding protein from transposon X-element [Caerostris darwini]|uniref:Nucleic-acid-binding protein from transposon X-element n=1 Tax=Caerostris darwini TaxID=1538125 RepID=A0AAV4PLU5_9ARAC|nr:nucleic-acid-binding protein from transposon X-element [Caerostris darwini]